jgi:transcriptional regulator with XRE-family HTH domain
MISLIEELIIKSGLKKSFIADKLEVSVKQLRNYETGYSLIPIDKAFVLADLLKVKIDDLYERKKSRTETKENENE